MKVGDLVTAKNTSTGDREWFIKLWRDRTPVLLVYLYDGDSHNPREACVLHEGERMYCEPRRLMVVHESR